MMKVSVEPLKSADVEEAARLIASLPLYQDYGMNNEKAKAFLERALKDPNAEVLAAHEGTKIAGVAWFVKNGGFGRSGYLRLIAVAESYQCSGVGRRLIEDLESRHLAPHGIFILVTSTNEHARRFYDKLGYEKVGEIRDFVKKG